jgi:hypothetical protein
MAAIQSSPRRAGRNPGARRSLRDEVAEVLVPMGLRLPEDKTVITHIDSDLRPSERLRFGVGSSSGFAVTPTGHHGSCSDATCLGGCLRRTRRRCSAPFSVPVTWCGHRAERIPSPWSSPTDERAVLARRDELGESWMRGNTHVRFGGAGPSIGRETGTAFGPTPTTTPNCV